MQQEHLQKNSIPKLTNHILKLAIAFQTSNLLNVKNLIEIIDIISTNIINVLLPPFLPSFLIIIIILIIVRHRNRPDSHGHHHHHYQCSLSSSFLPSIFLCSVLPSSFLPPSITSIPPLCWCNEQNQFLEFLNESKVRCFSKTKEIPGIFHLKSGKNPGIFGRKVTT